MKEYRCHLKALLIVVAFLVGSSALAQGVLDQLTGDFKVLAQASNEVGTLFVEVDSAPENVEVALRNGILHENSSQFVLIVSPGRVYTVNRDFGVLYSERTWTQFVRLANNSQGLSLQNLNFSGLDGYKLTPEYIEASIVRYRYGVDALARTNALPRNGCLFTASSRESTMSCFQDGRLVYRSACSVNSALNVASCRVDSD